MASSEINAGIESNSGGESPGTPGTPGSNESDVPEEFYAFRDLICPELFRENMPRNTSALQGAGWVAEIMTTPHQGRFFDNIRMTKPCFYALVDALTSRGLLPQGLRRSDGRDIGTCLGPPSGPTPISIEESRLAERKYYLVDAGFANYQCFLAPYRGTRYHLPEWRGQGHRYRNPQDMFNHAHSRLRNVIERCFGVLKKRFPIIQWGMPSYLQHHQVDIVIACCTLHNFIRRFSNDDIIFNEPDEDTLIDMDSFYHRGHPTNSEIEAQRTVRDSIAMQMWADKHPN
ncbi:UNVERIFIED_CONTAM: hypothetical protein Sradi_2445000 [Sesamum radiatum]|uniref:DDE Tnp4 domain-containing protein n=1 Tax=Sesamum radiatum TaxID=300843 RepID=A0AAW2SIF1_SESRA